MQESIKESDILEAPTKASKRIVRTYKYLKQSLGIDKYDHLYDVLGLVREAEHSFTTAVKLRHEHGDHSMCGDYIVGGEFIMGGDNLGSQD